ncbi:MAG: hypothetical protein ACKVTZ_10360 [Bacteroidia bacterium]
MPFENFEDKLRKKLEQAEVSPTGDLWQKIDAQLQGSNFENNLRLKLENSSLQPSERVWENIYRALHGQKTKKIVFYWKEAAAVAAVILVAIWAFSPNPHLPETQITIHTNTTITNPTVPNGQVEAPNLTVPSKSTNELPVLAEKATTQTTNIKKQENISLAPQAKAPNPILTENVSPNSIHTPTKNEPLYKEETTTKSVAIAPTTNDKQEASPKIEKVTALHEVKENEKLEFSTKSVISISQIQAITTSALNESIEKQAHSFANLWVKEQGNAGQKEDWWAKVELPKPEKRNHWNKSFALGSSKISYNSYQSYPIESWNRLGIGSVTVIDDSVGNQVLNYPRQLGEIFGSQNADIELLVSKNTQYAGMGFGYEITKWLEIESGLRVQYQKLRSFVLPLDVVETANKAGVLNPYQDWVRNYDKDYITRSTDPLTANEIAQRVEVDVRNNWVAEIPMMLKFKLPLKRSILSVSTGASYRQLLNQLAEIGAQKSQVQSPPVTLGEPQPTSTSNSRLSRVYRNQNGTVNLKVEYAYRISPKNSIFLAGSSQWFINSMFGEETTLRYPRLLGVETGMHF